MHYERKPKEWVSVLPMSTIPATEPKAAHRREWHQGLLSILKRKRDYLRRRLATESDGAKRRELKTAISRNLERIWRCEDAIERKFPGHR